MFRRRTAIVIGAGASAEYDLPLGEALKARVAEMLRSWPTGTFDQGGDVDLYQSIGYTFKTDFDEYCQAAEEVSRVSSLFSSTDDVLRFLQTNNKALIVGKAAISKAVIKSERQSRLFSDTTDGANLASLDGTWLPELVNMALAGTTEGELGSLFSTVTLINFNYDRCVEHYLHTALSDQLGVGLERAAEIGPLPWQDPGGTSFGGVGGEEYAKLGGNIMTIGDGGRETSIQQSIRSALKKADLILLLGFGFLQSNMQLLSVDTSRTVPVFGTMYGIDPFNKGRLKGQLQNSLMTTGEVDLLHKPAGAFLAELRPSLMPIMSAGNA